jgi:hypothetical protein
MMLESYPTTFTFVEIHIGDAYGTTWGNARHTFYTAGNGHTGTPEAWFDGTLECYGAYTDLEMQYNWYRTQYDQRAGLPPPVIIRLTGEQVSGQTYEVTASLRLHPNWGAMPLTFRFNMVQVLDNWPPDNAYSRNGFKQAATSQDVTLVKGQWAKIERTFTFDSTSWANQDDIKIIAWAQTTASAAPAEVYNAAQMTWPFPPDVPGDANCDGVVNNFDINAFVLALTNPTSYLQQYGCPVNADVNGDGAIDNFDINAFVDVLSGG